MNRGGAGQFEFELLVSRSRKFELTHDEERDFVQLAAGLTIIRNFPTRAPECAT